MEKHWTNEEALAHGREWLAAGWCWRRGQVALLSSGFTAVVVRVNDRGWPMACGVETLVDGVPDLRDPGTRGHALAQVEKAWTPRDLWKVTCDGPWHTKGTAEWWVDVWIGDGDDPCRKFREASLSAALLAARRAAP